VRNTPGQARGALSFSLNGTTLAGFANDPALGNLKSVNAGPALAAGLLGDHVFIVQSAGNLAIVPPRPGDPAAFDDAKFLDVLLLVEYRLKP
jgi:hypothetical protein